LKLAHALVALVALGLASAPLLVACKSSPSQGAGEATAEPASGGSFHEVHLEPGATPLPEVIAQEQKKARAMGLRLYVELGATWCKPCKELEASMSDPRMKAAFKGTYIVHLDIDAWGGKLASAKLSSASIPVFFALDAAGKPTGSINGGAWDANTPANMAPKLAQFFAER
jgi:thiol-disulfide isomerase/thioredoxin